MKNEEQAIVVRDSNSPVSFAGGIQMMSVADQNVALAQYSERRDNFRAWLLSKLVEGVHYGFPPGCEVKFDKDGNILQFNRRKGEWVPIPRAQWQAKPSLYKAGALYLKDLLRLRDEYTSDIDGWKMLGEPKGLFVRKCTMLANGGEVVGEGTGCFKVGDKGMDENGAVKMADKRALVAAVINTLATCADLFTQDVEDSASGAGGASSITTKSVISPDAESKASFAAMVQEWVEESVDPEGPMGGHKLTSAETKVLRAQLCIWCASAMPDGPEAAVAWLKENAAVFPVEDRNGEVRGIKFGLKDAEKRTVKADAGQQTDLF